MRNDDLNMSHSEWVSPMDAINPPDAAHGGTRHSSLRKELSYLGVLLIGGVGITLMSLKNPPQSASGAPPGIFNAAPAILDDPSVFKTNSVNAATQESMQLAHLLSTTKTQTLATDLKVNPFQCGSALADMSDSLANSAARQRRETERQEVLTALQSLKLQSIMEGNARRACLINNALFQEGQQINGFLIEEIAPDAVVVRKGMYRFELKWTR